ncbi:cytosine permease [Candidatus Hecatella orcuttiae]|jgi:purine-cytosine permease-like protein|uniref:cytosine permease n=1 Tax=Candidatus Hecatella orcuttiae TaxID=1935119 RepID=UPI002867B1A0|nr:cytosine permease [Candidatus Hecatella orcuttiae]
MAKEAIEKEVLFGALPVLAEDRVYGFVDYVWLQMAYGIASWAFLVGGLTGIVLPATEAITAAIAGEGLGLFASAFYAVIFGRYGADQFLLTRAAFGNRGGNLQLAIWIPINYGWIAYSAFLFGMSAIKLTPLIWPQVPSVLATVWPGATLWAVIATAIASYVAWKGPIACKWFTRVTSPLMLIVLGGLIYYIFAVEGIGAVFARQPVAAYETRHLSWMNAFEWNLGLGFAWCYYWGQWSRLAKTESAALHGPWWGWGPVLCIAVVFSILTALIVGTFDPTDWFMAIGGATFGGIGLFLFAIANIGSIVLLIYTAAIPIKVAIPRIRWVHASVTIAAVPAVVLFQEVVFNNYAVFLTLIGCLWTVYGAIIFTDFFAFRKKKGYWTVDEIRDMYMMGKIFRYHKGFNLAAWITYLSSVIIYLGVYNPLTGYVGYFGVGFPWVSGLLLVFGYAIALYWLLMHLIYPQEVKRLRVVE